MLCQGHVAHAQAIYHCPEVRLARGGHAQRPCKIRLWKLKQVRILVRSSAHSSPIGIVGGLILTVVSRSYLSFRWASARGRPRTDHYLCVDRDRACPRVIHLSGSLDESFYLDEHSEHGTDGYQKRGTQTILMSAKCRLILKEAARASKHAHEAQRQVGRYRDNRYR